MQGVLVPYQDEPAWRVQSSNSGFDASLSWDLWIHDIADHDFIVKQARRRVGRGSEEAIAIGSALYRAWMDPLEQMQGYINAVLYDENLPCVGKYRGTTLGWKGGQAMSVEEALARLSFGLYEMSGPWIENTLQWMRLGWYHAQAAVPDRAKWLAAHEKLREAAQATPLCPGRSYRVRLDFDNNRLDIRSRWFSDRVPSWSSNLY
jgi:hypothetical protein